MLQVFAYVSIAVVFVFIDKAEALKLMKKFPGSRFKPSSTRLDAVRFSRGLPDLVPASPKPHCLHVSYYSDASIFERYMPK